MKRLSAIFTVAVLAGCSPVDDAPSVQQMQTMMSTAPGQYTFMPNTQDPLLLPISANSNPWDLTVKMNEYQKTENGRSLHCAKFRTIVVNLTDGQYLLPYQRTVSTGESAAYQSTQVALKDFGTDTLLNIPEKLQDADRPADPYVLTRRMTEVCVPRPDAG